MELPKDWPKCPFCGENLDLGTVKFSIGGTISEWNYKCRPCRAYIHKRPSLETKSSETALQDTE